MNRGSSDSSVTVLQDGEPRNRCQEGAWDLVSPSRRAPWLWDPSSLIYNGYCVIFSVLKGPTRGADNLLPTTATRAKRGAKTVITVPSYAFNRRCSIFKYKK
jgi:hypothetical protein